MNMKKISILMLSALALFFVGCNEDEGSSEGGDSNATAEALVGKWSLDLHGYKISLNFTKTTLDIETPYSKENFTYTFKDGVLATKIVSRKVNRNDSWVDDPIHDTLKVTLYYKPIILYDSSVLVLRYDTPDMQYGQGGRGEVEFYFREGRTCPATAQDIQGNWCWRLFGEKETARATVKFEGNNFDLKILPWGERYLGTFTYENGIVVCSVTEFQVRENVSDGGSMKLEDVDKNWRLPTENDYRKEGSFGLHFSFPFITNGNESYCNIANLSALFYKL